VATQCTRCGIVLPKDNARFCNNCGATIPIRQGESSSPSPDVGVPAFGRPRGDFSQSQPPSSFAASTIKPPDDEKLSHSGSRPAIREQIAYQPPVRPSKHPKSDEPPAWMNRLERGVSSAKLPAEAKAPDEGISTTSWSTLQDAIRVSKKEILPEQGDGVRALEQLAFPSPDVVHPIQHRDGPPRELHVKVWQPQEEGDNVLMPETGAGLYGVDAYPVRAWRQAPSRQSSDDDEVEDVPTAHLAVERLSGQVEQNPSVPISNGQRLTEENRADDLPTGPLTAPPPGPLRSRSKMPSHLDEVEQLETRPMASQRQGVVQPSSPTTGKSFEQRERVPQEMAQPSQRPALQKPVSALSISQPEIQPVREVRTPPNTPLPSVAVSPRMARSRRKSRKPLIFILILSGLLLAGGLGTWIVVYRPFAVPAVTNTDQPFQNSTLGIALRYPQGWTAHFDPTKGSVSFNDSSHTGQVTVIAAPVNGSIAQYIKKEAAQLGITDQTNQPSLTFAGASWQQVKGSLVQNGATYSAIQLVTEHKNRFYTIMQLAPPAAYNGEEQLVFSHVRSSFQFL
jgi:hypothetical protein